MLHKKKGCLVVKLMHLSKIKFTNKTVWKVLVDELRVDFITSFELGNYIVSSL